MPTSPFSILRQGGVGFRGRGIAAEFESVARVLREVPVQAPLEVARGLNDGGNQVRTIVQRTLKDQMGLAKLSDVIKVVRTVPASPDHLRYEITSSKGGMNIQDFNAIATPAGIQAHVWGIDKTFKRSFVSKSGFMLARTGASRFPVRRLYGPAPYKELIKGETLAAFDRSVPLLVEPIVMRRVVKLLTFGD